VSYGFHLFIRLFILYTIASERSVGEGLKVYLFVTARLYNYRTPTNPRNHLERSLVLYKRFKRCERRGSPSLHLQRQNGYRPPNPPPPLPPQPLPATMLEPSRATYDTTDVTAFPVHHHPVHHHRRRRRQILKAVITIQFQALGQLRAGSCVQARAQTRMYLHRPTSRTYAASFSLTFSTLLQSPSPEGRADSQIEAAKFCRK
jgi:hypothetical protein